MAGNFSGDARRLEEGEEHWRSGLVSYAVAIAPVINEEREQVMVMRWKGLDTRRSEGQGITGAHELVSIVVATSPATIGRP